MYFELLRARLVDNLRERVRSGELTERRLARLTGVSQPHLHNVLKGVRELSAGMADQVVMQLHLSPRDLLAESELGPGAHGVPYEDAPLLEGSLGPDHPFPDLAKHKGTIPFLRGELAGIQRPLGVRLAADPNAAHLLQEGDLALLAPCEENGGLPERHDAGSYFAVDLVAGSLIRRVERRGHLLLLLPEAAAEEPRCISLADRNILEVIRARVIWIGRHLERSPIADRQVEEVGGEHRPPGGKR